MEQYHTIAEVMERLHISRDTVTSHIKMGKLPGTVKIGTTYRIPDSGLERYLSELSIEPARAVKLPRTAKKQGKRRTAKAMFEPLTMDIFKT